MNQYVQHKSGIGAKWKVHAYSDGLWQTVDFVDGGAFQAQLPKSEYEICAPPEVWVDVTDECVLTFIGSNLGTDQACKSWHVIRNGKDVRGSEAMRYRLRKVPAALAEQGWTIDEKRGCWVFIVEYLAP